MKRRSSIILSFSVVLLAFCIICPAKAQAASSEPTYLCTHNAYRNSFGQAEFTGTDLIAGNTAGTQYKAFSIVDYNDYNNNVFHMSFYMRGRTVYYSITPLNPNYFQNGSEPQEIWAFNVDSGDKELIARDAGDIIGGYGSNIITRRWDTGAVYKVRRNSKAKLLTVQKGKSKDNDCISLFQGKLYYSNRCFDLDTGKISTFTAGSIVTTGKYMYYVSGAKNLVCMNSSGKKTYCAKNIRDIIGGNNNANAVFRKNSNGALTIYRVNSKGRIYKLTAQNKLEKAAFGGAYPADTTRAVFCNGKVCFFLQSGTSAGAVVTVPNTGGPLKKEATVHDGVGTAEVVGKTVYYTQLGFDDFDHNCGCKLNVK